MLAEVRVEPSKVRPRKKPALAHEVSVVDVKVPVRPKIKRSWHWPAAVLLWLLQPSRLVRLRAPGALPEERHEFESPVVRSGRLGGGFF